MFACVDQVLNGTVTMQIITSVIDKPTFAEAVKYFKEKYGSNIEISEDSKDRFSYRVKQEAKTGFAVFGSIEREPLKLL